MHILHVDARWEVTSMMKCATMTKMMVYNYTLDKTLGES